MLPFSKGSNAINHIFCVKNNPESNNYLDDFLLIALLELWCNDLLVHFLELCEEINFPVSMDKTEFATQIIVFLGMLLNTKTQTRSIPADKVLKALEQLAMIMTSKKVTVLQLQKLTGLLNFISRVLYNRYVQLYWYWYSK